MIFDPEQVRTDFQRRVYLATIQMIAALDYSPGVGASAPTLELSATIDGLLEVIAALLVEARVLPDPISEQQICEDVGNALLFHIRQSASEFDEVEQPARH